MLQNAEWYEHLDLSKITDSDRYRILEYIADKVGRGKVQEALNISRITMWRLLNKQSKVDDGKLRTLLSFLTPREFEELLSAEEKLKAAGIIRDDGTIEYSTAIEILKKASQDEYLKQLMIKFVISNFKEDVKRAIGLFPASVEMHWSKDFEKFLKEEKKGRKITDEGTITYYRNLFLKELEGKQLTPYLVDYVVNHKNKWLRNVFRHYIRYLYHKRKIPLETFGWIMEVVPARKWKKKVKAREINIEHVIESLEFLKKNHELYYLYYVLMYFSGARFKHVIKMIAQFTPSEIVKLELTDSYTERLVCFEDKGFCRYYLGLHTGKECEWVYFPTSLLALIEKYKGTERWDDTVSRYARRHKLVGAKVFRELHWQIMKKVIDKDIARFIQSRFGELEVSASSYDNLLRDADIEYPKVMSVLKEGLQDPKYLSNVLLEKIRP